MRSTTTLLAALVGLLALAGVASAQTAECPECDEDVPANDDCTYSSVDTGFVGKNATSLVDTDLCVREADESGGWWAVFSLCLTQVLEAGGELIGVFVTLDIFASEDGLDVDGGIATTDGEVLDFDDSPIGDLDDQTWEAGEQSDLPALPGTGGALPDEGAIVNECVYETDLVPCES